MCSQQPPNSKEVILLLSVVHVGTVATILLTGMWAVGTFLPTVPWRSEATAQERFQVLEVSLDGCSPKGWSGGAGAARLAFGEIVGGPLNRTSRLRYAAESSLQDVGHVRLLLRRLADEHDG